MSVESAEPILESRAILAAGGPAPAPLGLLDYCERTGACGAVAEVLSARAVVGQGPRETAAVASQRSGPRRVRADASLNFTMMLNAAALGREGGARREEPLTRPRWRARPDNKDAVNRAIIAESDINQFGVTERWSRPLLETQGTRAQARGDCEDYALEKRERLLAAGWAPESVLLAVAELQSGGLHTVVVAHTDRGDFVLDNLRDAPQPVALLDYTWISRQSGPSLSSWSQARLALLAPHSRN
ncbi:MAG: transglutaminase-like cysteine peptidase [Hyphomonadaceae bacterium]|nr:transglutaminase-like cysteine peptidase [Hyphomonadaceae bacterium]